VKIAIMTDVFPSLSETFILSQIGGLLEQGHEVLILAERMSQDLMVHSDVKRYHLLERAFFLPPIPKKKAACLLKAFVIWLANFPYYPGPMLRFLKLYLLRRNGLSLKVLYYLVELCRHPVDILFCHYGTNGIIGSLLKESLPSLKLVTMFHGYDVRLGLEKGGQIYHSLFENGDLLLANSRFTSHLLQEFGAFPEKIRVHPVGVDLTVFCPPSGESRKKPEKLILLSVGRLVEEKGHQYALQAIKIFQEKNPGIKFRYRIVGGGPLEGVLRELAEQLSLSEIVEFCGPASHERVLQYLMESDIFIHPSISEAFGLSIIEAQALGLPVVATRVGGIPEAVLDEQTGYLVPERDSRALAEKIQYLAEHPEIRREMGRRGREYVRNNYDIRELNRRLEDIFLEMLSDERDLSETIF